MTIKHGKWQSAQLAPASRHHGGYCNMSGAHLTNACGIKHRGATQPCEAFRLYCPELGTEIHQPGDFYDQD